MKSPAIVLLVVAAGAGLATHAARAQAPQVTFRAGVDLVDVEVSVLDRNRLPVRGLAASDFTVLEEGRPRPIVAFAPVDLPARVRPTAAWMDEISADTHTNAFPREGRLIVILMDRTIPPADYPEARRIAEGAVQHLREGDMAAVAWALHGVPQNFTADRQRLLDAIREPDVNLPDTPARGGECDCGRCSMEAIAHVAEAVQDINWRRKLLIFIGSRLPGNRGGCGSVNDPMRRRALRAAEAGNLTIYAVDPRGLQTLSPPAALRGPARSAFVGAELRRVAALTAFTEPTGGRFVNRNQPSEVLPEIFRESASYYVLGFEPADANADGRFRRITVRVNRRDVVLQARRGYYTPGRPAPDLPAFGEGVSPALSRAVSGLWPKTDVRLTLAAAPVAMPGVRGGAVAVVVNVRHDPANTPAREGPLAPGAAEARVLVGAFDHTGRAVALDRRTLKVALSPVPGEGSGALEYEFASRLQLRPGRYEIRAAVEDTVRATAGSAYTYVDVPDFARELVSLSGVFIQAGMPATPVLGARIADLTPLAPTTRRRFARTETVTAFVREYQSASRTFMPGYAVTEITDANDTRVYHQQQRILPAEEGHRPMDFQLDVPVARLAPGPYLLTFEVRHGNESARRDVRFHVE
jgi:VWFA-related protein